MHLAVQQQPIAPHLLVGPSQCPAMAPSRPEEVQARIDDAILQAVSQLVAEMMRDPQVMKGLSDLLQNFGAGASPSTPDAFSCQRPTQPQGAGGAAGEPAPGGAAPTVASPAPAAAQAPAAVADPAPAAARPTAQAQAPAATDAPVDAGKGPVGMSSEQWQSCVDAGKKTGVDPFVLAAQMEKESRFGSGLAGSPSAGDGLMQVEPTTRDAYAGKFEASMGHAYDHTNPKDQVAMAAVILADKGGDTRNMLQKYNGGDNWAPGTTDSYGRVIKADEYAATVMARAAEMRKAGG
jgi:hypothetical protein